MDAPSLALALLFYAAAAAWVIGVARRVMMYARVPAPLKIPTTPAPATRFGVGLRLAREVLLFESLFRANLWLWMLGWLFHASLALVLARHLRYFMQPVWPAVVAVQPLGVLAGLAMPAALTGLWARRVLSPRVRFISTASDHLMLALLMAIALSGLAMKWLSHTDIVGVKTFFLGWMRFRPQPLPGDPVLYLHLTLVATLLTLFPLSKLLHAPGIFFSPTRNQVDNPRQARHLSAWAAPLDAER